MTFIPISRVPLCHSSIAHQHANSCRSLGGLSHRHSTCLLCQLSQCAPDPQFHPQPQFTHPHTQHDESEQRQQQNNDRHSEPNQEASPPQQRTGRPTVSSHTANASAVSHEHLVMKKSSSRNKHLNKQLQHDESAASSSGRSHQRNSRQRRHDLLQVQTALLHRSESTSDLSSIARESHSDARPFNCAATLRAQESHSNSSVRSRDRSACHSPSGASAASTPRSRTEADEIIQSAVRETTQELTASVLRRINITAAA